MKYLVMENQKAFSIVIDEEGRILRVANLGYIVGERVTDVIPFEKKPLISKKAIATISSFAACFILAFVGFLSLSTPFTPYANVYLTVNPQVKLVVDQKNKVGEVEALNGDGAKLLFDYDYKKKSATVVLDELLDRAIELGMLQEGGAIAVDIDGADQAWVQASQLTYEENITSHMAEKMTVTIQVKSYTPKSEDESEWEEEPSKEVQVIIPTEKVGQNEKKPVDQKKPQNSVKEIEDDTDDTDDDSNEDLVKKHQDDDNDDDTNENDDDDNDNDNDNDNDSDNDNDNDNDDN